MKHLKVRIPMYFIGLFVMTIGIALSVKSNLGVSPVSSIPYTITCVWALKWKSDDPFPHRTGIDTDTGFAEKLQAGSTVTDLDRCCIRLFYDFL